MNLYQLVPTSCDDDDDYGEHSEFWSSGTPDAVVEDGRSSRNGFYDDVVDDSGVEERTGWYSVDGCTAAVPPVPHVLPLDAQRLRFFDDDDSSVENETFFGRTLDTISEEDEDEDNVMERVAATEADNKGDECALDGDHRSADFSKLADISLVNGHTIPVLHIIIPVLHIVLVLPLLRTLLHGLFLGTSAYINFVRKFSI